MKRIDIEALVRWAYRDELPKAQADAWSLASEVARLGVGAGWDAVSAFGKLLAVVDVNAYGVVSDKGARTDPHPDALRVHQAVATLDGLDELGLPDDWAPLADLGDLGDAGVKAVAAALDKICVVDSAGVRRLRQSPRVLVFKHAILGGAPDWVCDVPEVKFVRPAHGGPPLWFVKRRMAIGTDPWDQPIFDDIEMDGYNHTRQRPYPDAYRKTYLDPDPMWGAVGRAEYEIWHAALGALAEDLAGVLTDHEVIDTPRSERPWEDPEVVPGRVLADLTPQPQVRPEARRRGRKGATV